MEKLGFALQVVFIGFSVVMIALFALYLLLKGFNFLKRKDAPEAITPKNIFTGPSPDHQGLNPRLVAVITASVYAIIGQDRDKSYRVNIVTPLTENSVDHRNWVLEGRKALFEVPK